VAAAQAFDYVGLPEGRFHLAEACLYLATAPKSNSTLAFFDAFGAVEHEREAEVPNHLRDGNRDAEDFGHGKGYLYPHAYRDHWTAQQYLPDSLQGRVFYNPSDQGYEASIQAQVARRREEQLAAMLEREVSPAWEIDTLGQGPSAHNRWLQRTLSNVGQQLGQMRDQVFALARVERHDLVLDLNTTTGLLIWEAVRRAPVGGVWARATDERAAAALQQQVANLAGLERPVILSGPLTELPQLITANLANPDVLISQPQPDTGTAGVRFDVIVGRNGFTNLADKTGAAQTITGLLKQGGRLALVEIVPRHTQRLHALADLSTLPDELVTRIVATEEAIYANEADPMVNWPAEALAGIFEQAGLTQVEVRTETIISQRRIEPEQIERWFAQGTESSRPTFAQHLLTRKPGLGITPSELADLKRIFTQQLAGQVVSWHSTIAYVAARKS
jgi:putative ATPase